MHSLHPLGRSRVKQNSKDYTTALFSAVLIEKEYYDIDKTVSDILLNVTSHHMQKRMCPILLTSKTGEYYQYIQYIQNNMQRH